MNLQKSKFYKEGRLPDGSMAFKIILPPALADQFEREMKAQDRKKLPLARYIIASWFKERSLRRFEEFTQLREAVERRSAIPHFGEEPDLQRGEAHRKASR